MNPRICICCGEPISEAAERNLDNPNLCFACSRFVDSNEEWTEARTDGEGLVEANLNPGTAKENVQNAS
jgi:hypothetical protein